MNDIDAAFLVEAEILLQEGKAREAAELCTRGLVKYPEYFTVYKILIQALEEMGDSVQKQEVIESAPNLVRVRLEKSGLIAQVDIQVSELESTVEPITIPDVVVVEAEVKIAEVENSEADNSVNIKKEINQALRNDELSPELLGNLTKEEEDSEQESEEEINIKETLTLAKIYEQQDAYQLALDIYKQLQDITEDKSVYADKIIELEALTSEV